MYEYRTTKQKPSSLPASYCPTHTLSHHNNRKNLSSHSLTMPPKKDRVISTLPNNISADFTNFILARPVFAAHKRAQGSMEYVIPWKPQTVSYFLLRPNGMRATHRFLMGSKWLMRYIWTLLH